MSLNRVSLRTNCVPTMWTINAIKVGMKMLQCTWCSSAKAWEYYSLVYSQSSLFLFLSPMSLKSQQYHSLTHITSKALENQHSNTTKTQLALRAWTQVHWKYTWFNKVWMCKSCFRFRSAYYQWITLHKWERLLGYRFVRTWKFRFSAYIESSIGLLRRCE